MNNIKIVLNVAAVVLVIALGHAVFVQTGPEDLRLKKSYVSATRLTDPSPGEIYGFDHFSNKFQQDMLCPRSDGDYKVVERKAVYFVEHEVGRSIPAAIDFVSNFISSVARSSDAGGPDKPPFAREFAYDNAFLRRVNFGRLDDDCIARINEFNSKGGRSAYRVEQVFYRPDDEGDKQPEMVVFEPMPYKACSNPYMDTKLCPLVDPDKLIHVGFFPRIRQAMVSVEP